MQIRTRYELQVCVTGVHYTHAYPASLPHTCTMHVLVNLFVKAFSFCQLKFFVHSSIEYSEAYKNTD